MEFPPPPPPPPSSSPPPPCDNRAPFMIGMGISMLMVAIAATTVRSFLRWRGIGRLAREDWCCIGATFILVNMVIVHGFGARYGIGKHYWDLDPTKAEKIGSIKTDYIACILYPLATGLTRQSILFLLLRIFSCRVFRRIVITMIIINVSLSIVSGCTVAFQCVPISNVFNPFVDRYGPRSGCLNSQHLAFAIPACNFILDVMVALLPVRMISKISLPVREKAMITGMLGLGALACVASCAQLVTIHTSSGKLDPTWYSVEIFLWAIAEVTIGIACVSAPTLGFLIKGLRRSDNSVTVSHNGHRSGTKSGAKTSFALASLKRPEKTKVRLRMRDDSSVERFRPNDVSRTITEIEAGSEGHRYGRNQDETSGDDIDDRQELVGNSGIFRRMEVAVTISDRV